MNEPLKITICMGSSCFSRGNNRNIEVVQTFATQKQGTVEVELVGHLCEGLCKSGPNIGIGGRAYQEVDPVTLIGLLNQKPPATREPS